MKHSRDKARILALLR